MPYSASPIRLNKGHKISNVNRITSDFSMSRLLFNCVKVGTNIILFFFSLICLSDFNIGKFNTVINKFSKESQFIIVTHNKLTMESSDYLYGVTQRKEGISNIVSVNLKDIETIELN